jgi:predicted metalloprotease
MKIIVIGATGTIGSEVAKALTQKQHEVVRASRKSEVKVNLDDPTSVRTASAIGDDLLQKETKGYVVPDAFTHGTSAQRKRWFMNGFKSGQLSACDTFSAESL